MQRLVTSSTRAIRTTLERRLEALEVPSEQLPLFPEMSDEEWADLDGQEQMETLLTGRLMAIKNERAEVRLLLDAARRTEEQGADAKAEALLDWIYRLQQEEGDPELKVLIFTEFVPTQEMLLDFLTQRGFSVVCLNGSMGMDERVKVQEAFAGETRILVSTEAGGEGLNLQFCHVVINYDIPWNPMRLEQRIGRVDRIGQDHPVRAVNFILRGTVEHRVREVLEEKLAVILEEFGVDKTGDILDSAEAGRMFDDLYIEAILQPEELQVKVESLVERVRQQGEAARDSLSVLGSIEDLDPGEAQRLLAHPFPHWVERMTVGYLQTHGGRAKRSGRAWEIAWPGEEEPSRVVFTLKDSQRVPSAKHLTLEDPRVRGLATQIARFAPGQPIPCVTLKNVPAEVRGLWSLWRITLHTPEWNRHRVMPLFVQDDGRTLAPTARFAWDQVLIECPPVSGYLEGDASTEAFERSESAAREQARQIYDELVQSHRLNLEQEWDKGAFGFAARRRAIQRIGLPAVRHHRLAQLAAEEAAWRSELQQKSTGSPELDCLLIARIEGEP